MHHVLQGFVNAPDQNRQLVGGHCIVANMGRNDLGSPACQIGFRFGHRVPISTHWREHRQFRMLGQLSHSGKFFYGYVIPAPWRLNSI